MIDHTAVNISELDASKWAPPRLPDVHGIESPSFPLSPQFILIDACCHPGNSVPERAEALGPVSSPGADRQK
jgi:hypothetical protein